jgi:Prophage minor tail protein Z (GPZ)
MAASIEVKFEATRAEELLKQYPKRVERATMRALNRALTSGHTELARLISKDMGLKVSVVKAALKSTPATPARLEVRLAASAKKLPLIKFGARQTRSGVSYNIGTGGGGRKALAHAFIATMPTGHSGVFTRIGKFGRRGNPKLEKIGEKFGPSIGGVLAKYRNQGIAKMREAFESRLAHELKFAATEKT